MNKKKVIIILTSVIIIFFIYFTFFYVKISGGIEYRNYFIGELNFDDIFNMRIEITERIRPRNIFDFEGRKDFKYSDMRFTYGGDNFSLNGTLPVYLNESDAKNHRITYAGENDSHIAVFDKDGNGKLSKGDTFYLNISEDIDGFGFMIYCGSENNEKTILTLVFLWQEKDNMFIPPLRNPDLEAVIYLNFK